MSIDERRPLLESSDEGQDGHDLDPNSDPDNPRLWPATYKWAVIALLASMGFVVTFTCTSVVPLANHIIRDLDKDNSSKSASVLLVTIWELGEAAGPLFLAPLSEVFGRYPVVNTANVLFISATILAALCQSASVFISARALTGLAVAANVLNPAIVGDLMVPDQRGFAMSVVMMAPLLGGAAGPIIGSVVAGSLGWRQVIWTSVALAGICEVMFLTCFRETCHMVILRRKAKKLQREFANASPTAALPTCENNEGLNSIWESALRPVAILSGSGVLMILCLFSGVAFAFAYVLCVTLPDILEAVYRQPLAVQGPAFLSYTVGLGFSVILCNRLSSDCL
ncbi:major facilitator superfamily protein [Hirsutella rhossiliensis]|uniref:Major facilitator superfamily domain-containing protein n=1 Tax=Hirsutella rhossiliensis TaxID=111463 RepID=A0A9P8MRH7_9HYPO|nr:major facilitator superfamily domain-containing protein [Hirsutella rhossiliensis]KAH0958871.1 major facilitator superfamily domain-containing protein [Hirsutella rhossiliensis]